MKMKVIGLALQDRALDDALALLFRKKYEIINFNSSELAQSLPRLSNIDLLIVDVKAIDERMLKMILLLKKMRPTLPIIILYDVAVPESMKAELFPIANVMFRKPFSNSQLSSAVEDFLQD